jgi:hypothetical protein
MKKKGELNQWGVEIFGTKNAKKIKNMEKQSIHESTKL